MASPSLLFTTLVAAAATVAVDAAPQNRPSFSSESELVVLHVTVKDGQGRYMASLPQAAFSVFEDNQPQAITMFTREDAPVSVGLVIDNSGSMRENRSLVVAAAGEFAASSNPKDEIFALLFNEEIRAALPRSEPFTSDPRVLSEALAQAISPHGRTALFDAMAAGQEYLAQGQYERKALVLVSDGGDNVSHLGFDDVLRRTEASNVVVHAVALVDPNDREADPKKLERLARASGGVFYEPHDASQVADALKRVAADIRSAYTLGYVPGPRVANSGFHQIRVVVHEAVYGPISVRTRTGYIAGTPAAGSAHAR
jgi:VWFA-related protein